MAYTARVCPKFVPLSFHDQSPHQVFLVHERLHKYYLLSANRTTHAIALEVSLPGVPDFLVVNQHGPFTMASRTEFDTWFTSLAVPAVLGGDFNDAIWPNPPLRRRAWQDLLQTAALYDPLYQIHPLPRGPTHTRGAKRPDAFLIPHTLSDILNPTSYYTHTFTSAGDDTGVVIHTNNTLSSTDPPAPTLGIGVTGT